MSQWLSDYIITGLVNCTTAHVYYYYYYYNYYYYYYNCFMTLCPGLPDSESVPEG